ncbi:MAG: hypothetical protein ABL953_10085 [Ilumatobacteraceae bacterium]
MKGRITTVLSLTGVLVAGSAAAMVNTQVLQSTETKSSEQITVGSTDSSDPTTPVTITTDNTAGTATKIQSNLLTPTQALYQIGDAGLVTLDTAGDVLTVVSVEPASGWTLVKAENYGPADIEVKLTNGTMIVEFKANLQLGVITTSVESKLVGSDGTGGYTPGSGTIDDDDDDDHTSVTTDDDDDDHGDDDSDDDSGHGDDDD